MDSSEGYYLGGANGVRAYPSDEARGNSGNLARLELRWHCLTQWGLTAFYDHGRVRNSDGTPSYSLQGAGLALQWQPGPTASVAATLARRMGGNPNPTAAGNDQDGSLTDNRFWLTANLAF